eukprot:4717403-Alexandrium_andersonii.AAC.1
MSASLVGSEMCIRDRPTTTRGTRWKLCHREAPESTARSRSIRNPEVRWAVSYTHLTLPTICSV